MCVCVELCASCNVFHTSYVLKLVWLFKNRSARQRVEWLLGHLVALPSFLLKSLWFQPPWLTRAASEQKPFWRLRDADADHGGGPGLCCSSQASICALLGQGWRRLDIALVWSQPLENGPLATQCPAFWTCSCIALTILLFPRDPGFILKERIWKGLCACCCHQGHTAKLVSWRCR